MMQAMQTSNITVFMPVIKIKIVQECTSYKFFGRSAKMKPAV